MTSRVSASGAVQCKQEGCTPVSNNGRTPTGTGPCLAGATHKGSCTRLLPALIKLLLQDWYAERAKYHRRNVTINTYISTVQDFVLFTCLTERSATAVTGTKS